MVDANRFRLPINPSVGGTRANVAPFGSLYYFLYGVEDNRICLNPHLGEDWNQYNPPDTTDTDILAVANGTVDGIWEYQGISDNWGNCVRIRHDLPAGRTVYNPVGGHYTNPSVWSFYAHLSSILVVNGQDVLIANPIGKNGGCNGQYPLHLHYEMRLNGTLGKGAGYGWQFDTDYIQYPELFIANNADLDDPDRAYYIQVGPIQRQKPDGIPPIADPKFVMEGVWTNTCRNAYGEFPDNYVWKPANTEGKIRWDIKPYGVAGDHFKLKVWVPYGNHATQRVKFLVQEIFYSIETDEIDCAQHAGWVNLTYNNGEEDTFLLNEYSYIEMPAYFPGSNENIGASWMKATKV